MDDLLDEFLTETNESIDIVDAEVVILEKDPSNKAVLDNIFRLVHTIKGTCGFLGLPRLESVAHASENVLGRYRDGELAVTPDSVTVILSSLDRIKEILGGLEKTGTEPQASDKDLIKLLDDIYEGKAAAAPAEESAPVVEEVFEVPEAPERELRTGEVSLEELEAVFQNAPGPEDIAVEEPVEEAPAEEEPAEDEPAIALVAGTEAPAQSGDGQAAAGRPKATQNIRVNVDLLEDLMNMVSELVLTRNQLMQMMRTVDDSDFAAPIQRLSQCTTELQESVMKTRMQPIGNAWTKLPRIVRDLSLELKKDIELVKVGEDTELDRQVLELIRDPLTHMVRNSADHGIETPAVRIKAGKPAKGMVRLSAFHEGGHIVIEIVDDGAGLDAQKLKANAIKKGTIPKAELDAMNDGQLQRLIFHAGFSTAKEVTSVSGRGVGMDVVRTNIEKIGGTIELSSKVGEGTTFSIKIPLTLAIVSSLIVAVGDHRFALPQINVVELVKTGTASDNKIEHIKNTPVLRLRNKLLPLVYLSDVLGKSDSDDGEGSGEFIVVTQVGAFLFGIVVEQVFDTEEIVVKPVAPILKDLSVYSGNTILGDGSVIMILDPNGVAAEAQTQGAEDESKEKEQAQQAKAAASDLETMLLFKAGSDVPKAVPLSLVARLEDVSVDDIEQIDNRFVVQYRGALMPLIPAAPGFEAKEEGRQPVLVFADTDNTMGLMVDEIVDIVEDKLNVELGSKTVGIVGSAIIGGKATEIVDIAHYAAEAFHDENAGETFSAPRSGIQVLLVDDSSFFRNMIKPLLVSAGYDVTTASDGKEALSMRSEGANFDLIISDIEMPGMSGLELADQVKTSGKWQSVPLVALSNHSSEKDISLGREAGFSDYVAKFNKRALLQSLSQQLKLLGDVA